MAVIIAGLAVYWQDRSMSAEPKVYHAIRAVKATMDWNARDQYIAEVKAFAQAFGFTTNFSQTSPNPNDIVAHLERDHVWTVGSWGSLFGGPELIYEFAFYSKRPISPASLDLLVEGLKLYLGRVPGAVVTEIRLNQ
jgi:hypothetical protein